MVTSSEKPDAPSARYTGARPARTSPVDLSSVDGWVIQDSDGVVVDVQTAGGTLFGWSHRELLHGATGSLVHPDDREINAEVRNRVRTEGGSQALQLRFRARNGRWLWVEVLLSAEPSVGGRLGEFTGAVVRDVSARYVGHEALSLLIDLRHVIAASASTTVAWHRTLERICTLGSFDEAIVWEPTRDGLGVSESWPREAQRSEGSSCESCEELIRRDVAATWQDTYPVWASVPSHDCLARRADADVLFVSVLASDGVIAVVELHGRRRDDRLESETRLISEMLAHIGDALRRKAAETDLAVARRRFELAFSEASIGMALVAPDGAFIEANAALCALLERSNEQIQGLGFQAVTHPDDLEADVAYVAQMLAGEITSYQMEKRYLRPSGDFVWGLLSVSLVRDAAGEPLHFISQIQDVTAQKAAERQLERSVARFRAAFDDSALGMALIALDSPERGVIIEANDEMHRICAGATDIDDVVGSGVDRIIEQAPGVFTFDDMLDLTTEDPAMRAELKARSAGDDERWLRVVAAPVRHEDEDFGRFVVLQVEDITDERRVQAEVTHLAMHDALTGLPNRVLMTDRIQRAQNRSARTHQHFGVLFIDLDNFKDVNDTFGHGHGDRLLVGVADRFRLGLRPGDSAARLGGDEFIVMCEDLSDDEVRAREELAVIAARLHAQLSVPIDVEGEEFWVSASVGSHVSIGSRESVRSILSNADTAMYEAKAQGRSRTEVYDAAVRAGAAERLSVTSELRTALGHDEMYMAYQPIVDLTTHDTVANEALLRWTHPDKGEIGPASFIPVAEASHLIVDIGKFVLERICAALSASGVPAGYVAMNVSARQLSQSDFATLVLASIAHGGIDPSRLAIELTESVLVEASTSAHHQLTELRDAGLRVGIDDFGTGYATLRSVKDLPVTYLKIDRSFVSGLATSRDDVMISKAVIGLADALGLDTIAEGVETREQADILCDLGCPHAQGYLFGRPTQLQT